MILPLGGAKRGPSKNLPCPHAIIWGPTPNFKISFCSYAEPLQMLKILGGKSAILEKKFKNFQKI